MAARVELANALKTRDDVVTCRNCGRILYLRKDT
jgi:predicted  nucleic acid-binding Zn-ribbon protein